MNIEQLKPAFEKAVRENNFIDENQKEIISELIRDGSKVIIMGGFGKLGEYLANEQDCQVTLVEESGLVASIRRKLVPNSKVKFININPAKFIVSGKLYEYAIVFSDSMAEHASKMAIKVINIQNDSITFTIDTDDIYTNDINNAQINEPQPETTPDQEDVKPE